MADPDDEISGADDSLEDASEFEANDIDVNFTLPLKLRDNEEVPEEVKKMGAGLRFLILFSGKRRNGDIG